jgi:hypothetical protein
MSNENMDAILRRIEKMLAMANDGRGNPEEAATAAAMAEKLMRKYQIDQADIIAASLKKGDDLEFAHVFANMKRGDMKRPELAKNPVWGQHLAVAIARLNDCQVRQSRALRPNSKSTLDACLTFYGFKGDVQVCVFMFDYIVGQLIAATKAFNESQDKGLWGKSGSEAFRRGFTSTVTARIYAMRAEKEREQLELSKSTALVVVKQQAITDKFGDFGYRETKRANVKDVDAYSRGREQGRAVDLNRRGIGNASTGSANLKLK